MAKNSSAAWFGGYSEGAVAARLEPYHPLFAESIVAAWKRWLEVVKVIGASSSARTRRNHLYDLIVEQIRQREEQLLDARIIETRYERILVAVPGEDGVGPLVLRFKHLDDDLRSRNYPTQTARAFDAQRPLPGFPAGMRLTFGYQLDAQETEVARLWVVQPNGRRNGWFYEVALPGSERVVEFPPQRTLADVAEPAAAAKRVRPKGGVVTGKASDNSVK